MSIFSSLVASVKAGTPLPQAIETAWNQTVQWGQQLVAKAEANPAYGAAVTVAVKDTGILVQDLEGWVGTGLDGDLANYSEELADLVVKYAPVLLGGATPAGAAGQLLLSALVTVGHAVISHEVLAMQQSAAAATGAPLVAKAG